MNTQFARWWSPKKKLSNLARSIKRAEIGDRCRLLQTFFVMTVGSALAAISKAAIAKDSSELPIPKRVLTGRDSAGKSVFKTLNVTPNSIDSNPD